MMSRTRTSHKPHSLREEDVHLSGAGPRTVLTSPYPARREKDEDHGRKSLSARLFCLVSRLGLVRAGWELVAFAA
jgi:hypothetical protein